MTISRTFRMAFAVAVFAALGIAACGGGAVEECPSDGVVCSSCAAGGDCDIQCDAGEQEFCGNFGFFDDPDLRCAFCDSSDDPFYARTSPLDP